MDGHDHANGRMRGFLRGWKDLGSWSFVSPENRHGEDMGRGTFVELHAERTLIDPHRKLVIVDIPRYLDCCRVLQVPQHSSQRIFGCSVMLVS